MAGIPGQNKKWAFSLTLLGVVLLVAVVIGNFTMWRSNQEKRTQIDNLNGEISQVNHKTQEIPAAPADLDAKLAAAKAALADANKVLPGSIKTNDIIGYIIDVADRCQVEAVPMVSQGAAPSGSGQSFREFTFSVTVTGTLQNATAFMSDIKGSEFPTLMITDCTVNKVQGTDFSRPENGTQVTLNLSIAVYIAGPATGEGGAS